MPASVVTVPEVPSDLIHHARIDFGGDVPAAKMLRQRHDTERDRHPRRDAWFPMLFARIAFDPDQFRRTTADIEQDRAAAFGIEQRRAADHRERCLGFAIDYF